MGKFPVPRECSCGFVAYYSAQWHRHSSCKYAKSYKLIEFANLNESIHETGEIDGFADIEER